MKILVVEDEPKIAGALEKGLSYEGYIVDVASDSDQALAIYKSIEFDAILLDWMIPGQMNGLELCSYLRKHGCQAGIVLLTAKNTIGDKVTGLDAGADDYLAKPFAFDELLARVRSLLRRPKAFTGRSIEVGNLAIDLVDKKVKRDGRQIDVTSKEFALLEYLALAKGRVISKNELIDHLWSDENRPMPNAIEAFIKRLRDKIDKPYPNDPLIHTQRGFGYKLQSHKTPSILAKNLKVGKANV